MEHALSHSDLAILRRKGRDALHSRIGVSRDSLLERRTVESLSAGMPAGAP